MTGVPGSKKNHIVVYLRYLSLMLRFILGIKRLAVYFARLTGDSIIKLEMESAQYESRRLRLTSLSVCLYFAFQRPLWFWYRLCFRLRELKYLIIPQIKLLALAFANILPSNGTLRVLNAADSRERRLQWLAGGCGSDAWVCIPVTEHG